MTMPEILAAIIPVLLAVAVALMFYFRVRGNVIGAISEFIAVAETTGLPGPEKMAQVVGEMAKMVPIFMRRILTDERLEAMAQWTFDWMRKYANEYCDLVKDGPDGAEIDAEAAKILGINAAADLIVELLNLTADELEQKALSYGINVDGLRTKKEFSREIVIAILSKA